MLPQVEKKEREVKKAKADPDATDCGRASTELFAKWAFMGNPELKELVKVKGVRIFFFFGRAQRHVTLVTSPRPHPLYSL
jgi:hypothetical protein